MQIISSVTANGLSWFFLLFFKNFLIYWVFSDIWCGRLSVEIWRWPYRVSQISLITCGFFWTNSIFNFRFSRFSIEKFVLDLSCKSDGINRYGWIRLMQVLLYCYERVHLQFHSFLSMGELRPRAETDRSSFWTYLERKFRSFFQISK